MLRKFQKASKSESWQDSRFDFKKKKVELNISIHLEIRESRNSRVQTQTSERGIQYPGDSSGTFRAQNWSSEEDGYSIQNSQKTTRESNVISTSSWASRRVPSGGQQPSPRPPLALHSSSSSSTPVSHAPPRDPSSPKCASSSSPPNRSPHVV